ncbi:hypothetical protein EX30DRAFT_354601 [Ascodesmis nigricans]|uniref:Uncharacterized protein n=1 Tax=Ascodesmis nigricans TaxID=341454 RepID=A0A4S2N0C2_9PEZI|nr:hypothetical protein EX30DRAFT_354601 [Ascodesmis nigricans]
MPSNRPFLSNLFLSFRTNNTRPPAHSLSSPSPASSPGSSSAASKSTSTSASTSTVAAAVAQQQQQQQQQQQPSQTQPIFTPSRNRRSSNSSTEGFVEPPSGEKWWIGGRNSDGQERFYRLQPVRRHRSYDRLSIDRMSL